MTAPPAPPVLPDVGIVVIGRDEGERLVACLASLAPLGLPVVYVDSGSHDDSCAVASGFGAVVVRLDPSKPFTAARARNEGAGALLVVKPTVQFLQFVDGDCTMDTNWIAAARAFLRAEPSYAVACGRRRERHPNASVYNRLADLEWETPIGDATACGGDALIRTSAFVPVGGFNDWLIAGEEPELCARLLATGWRIRRLDLAMSVHDMDMHRLRQWWRRSERAGYAFAAVHDITRHHDVSAFGREMRRAVLWGIGLPVLIVAMALIWPPFIVVGILIYGIQIVRMASRRSFDRVGWSHAMLITFAKFAEGWGVFEYWWARIIGRRTSIIEYK